MFDGWLFVDIIMMLQHEVSPGPQLRAYFIC
jgi:hypothetical protein